MRQPATYFYNKEDFSQGYWELASVMSQNSLIEASSFSKGSQLFAIPKAFVALDSLEESYGFA
jgi:hypothetical protein